MSSIIANLDEDERRFLNSLHGETDHEKATRVHGPNWEARRLFGAIQAAFTQNYAQQPAKPAFINPELVAYLAACNWVGLMYDQSADIPWAHHDSIIQHVLRLFMKTVQEAIEVGKVVARDDAVLYGCFHIPQWFYRRHREKRVA